LPKEWAHFKGHYVHNGRAIFSYSVGKGTVLDMPGVVEEIGFSAFTRTLETDLPEPGMVVLAEGESSHKAAATLSVKWAKQRINYLVTDGPVESTLSFENGLALLRVPAGKHRTKIAFWPGDPAYQPAVQSAAGQAEDLGSLTQGGDAQWGDPDCDKRAKFPKTRQMPMWSIPSESLLITNTNRVCELVLLIFLTMENRGCLYLGWGCLDRFWHR
jgi:hypothetical protein